jgi:predicted enzyme related to lactoylglutathione lyase
MMAQHAGRPHFRVQDIYLLILRGTPRAAENAEPARFPLFALAVDDLDAAVDRLESHGVSLPWGIEQDAAGRWVMFHDPGGNLIELVQWAQ